MAIGRLSQSGHITYGLTNFVVDSEDDKNDIPIEIPMGCKCFVIETSKNYMINSKGQWIELTGEVY